MRIAKNEPSSSRRRIPVYLVDTGGLPVTGAAPTGSQIKVSKSGAVFENGSGGWSEVGSGLYYYAAAQTETNTDSFALLRVAATGAKVVVFAVDVGDRIAAREATAGARRIPIYLTDSSGDGVPGLDLDGDIEVSVNGAALEPAGGTWDEIDDGCYYYEASAAELAAARTFLAIYVNDAGANRYVYAVTVVDADDSASDDVGDPIPDLAESGNVIEELDIVQHALDRVCLQFRGVT